MRTRAAKDDDKVTTKSWNRDKGTLNARYGNEADFHELLWIAYGSMVTAGFFLTSTLEHISHLSFLSLDGSSVELSFLFYLTSYFLPCISQPTIDESLARLDQLQGSCSSCQF